MKNNFIIISTCYNKDKWVKNNVNSLKSQSNQNFKVYYGYDKSTDNTLKYLKESIGEDTDKYQIIHNEGEKSFLGNFVHVYKYLKENQLVNKEDIIIEIDADDWLLHSFILQYLDQVYQNPDIWMTYGQYMEYPSGELGGHFNMHIEDKVDSLNAYRRAPFAYSHLRTYKSWLLDKISDKDLIDPRTGKYFKHAGDFALCMPMVEMAGKNRIHRVDNPVYVLNRHEDLENESKDNLHSQKECDLSIRSLPVRERIPAISKIQPILAGGLGNMMFQIAAAYGLSKKHNLEVVSDLNHVGTLHSHPSTYKDNLFKNLKILSSPLNTFKNIKCEPIDFSFQPNLEIPPGENIKLSGELQSYKYFDHCKDEIIKMFKNPNHKEKKGYVSMHVRRGDYVNLSEYHYNLNIDYYKNAIDYFKGYKFLVFSDDIEWCKENFKGNNFTFIQNDNDFDDLYQMSECEHNIIANSTFSWWGAYLNSNKNKIVVYPNKWFGSKYSSWTIMDLFPDNWVCLSENIPKIEVNLFDNAYKHLAKDNGRYSSVHGKISKHIKFVRDVKNYEGINLFIDECLSNGDVKNIKTGKKIGWLMETREVYPKRYDEFETYVNDFDYILTHDKNLLTKYPKKTKFVPFGGCWIKDNNFHLHIKNKNISMIYSNKTMFEGHKLRHQVANNIKGINLFGKGTPNPVNNKEESLVNYRYSIVIENSKADNYFTEKLIDCLAVGTIPIYWGCPNLKDYFNLDGIITFSTLEELNNILPTLNKNLYKSKLDAIKDNLEKSKEYNVTEDWIYKNIING
tara:strand:- start:80 stop:2452 length:2373 start_codon:yes stop_codon:yes gene_type:complete